MNKELLLSWLKEQQPKLEKILLKGAAEYYSKNSSKRTFSYDARITGAEMWQLSQGRDLCYDRPTIGFNYSLWYHPKRINTFLRYFTDLLYDAKHEKSIEIFDLGAGTGAVLWAVGLIVQGLKNLKLPCPKIRVINVDTSPFMLIYNFHYLWKNFIDVYPEAQDISKQSDYRVNSWSNNLDEANCTNIWLCASYLFDHSENSAAIANDFQSIVKIYKPNKILLLSAIQKRPFVDYVADSIKTLNYNDYNSILTNQIFSGNLNYLFQFRNQISQLHNLGLSGIPRWDIDSLYGKILINNNPQLNLDFDKLNLFVQPEHNRAKIRLTPQQEDAATINNRPTLVIGPAGCGKSVVLTQKVKNIIESTKIGNNYNPNLKILVTTFNKGLIKYLGDWIAQLLEADKFTRIFGSNIYGQQQEHSIFKFLNSVKPNIYVMHFDVLPTKIGRINWRDVTANREDIESFHLQQMENAILKYISLHNIDQKRFQKVLNPEFLLDEYHRIVYGNMCTCYTKKNLNDEEIEYSTIKREGRGDNPKVDIKTGRRKIVWGIINTYLRLLQGQNLESFTIRRHRFLKKLISTGFNEKFSHIIVDEFQDCTKADYEIFYQMLENPNNLTLAGDIAQAINLGASLHIPRTDDQRNFLKKKLEGSFRLPFRVSECIKPLSVSINHRFGQREGIQADIINPYKGAPPGARPIFVYAEDTDSAAEKIKEVFFSYNKALKLDKVTIFERDQELKTALFRNQIPAETEIILKTKGLEKYCVLWSTRTHVDTQMEKEEFIYTILTRTVSLLIILVFPNIQQEYINIIKQFNEGRIICWDEQSQLEYQEIQQRIYELDIQDDTDDSEDIQVSNEESIDIINI